MDIVMHEGRPVMQESEFTTLRMMIEEQCGYRPKFAADALNQAVAAVTMAARADGDWFLSEFVDVAYKVWRKHEEIYRAVAIRLGAIWVRRVDVTSGDHPFGTADDLVQTYRRMAASNLPGIPEFWVGQRPATGFLVARRLIVSALPVAI